MKIKRVYEKFDKDDGYRILVDRLWPRGVSKEKAKIDLWLKEVAPSNELRKWFSHDPFKWLDFKKKYFKELDSEKGAVVNLKKIVVGKKDVTLLFSAKDVKHNNAVALFDYLNALD